MKDKKVRVNKRLIVMVEVAVMVALAVICSFIKVWEMPQGGSIALTMIPLLLIAFRRGPAAGITAGAIYGVISMLLAGTIYHPMSILLDYILAFGLLGIAGFFGKSVKGIVLGSCAGVACRFVSSVVSGAVLFAEFAPEGQNPWVYSLIYQCTYMIPELIIAVAVLLLLYFKARRLFEVKES